MPRRFEFGIEITLNALNDLDLQLVLPKTVQELFLLMKTI